MSQQQASNFPGQLLSRTQRKPQGRVASTSLWIFIIIIIGLHVLNFFTLSQGILCAQEKSSADSYIYIFSILIGINVISTIYFVFFRVFSEKTLLYTYVNRYIVGYAAASIVSNALVYSCVNSCSNKNANACNLDFFISETFGLAIIAFVSGIFLSELVHLFRRQETLGEMWEKFKNRQEQDKKSFFDYTNM